MLGKYKIVRPNDLVLVAHSGNASSTVLTHLIRKGMEEAAHKRLMFKCIVVHIDGNKIMKLINNLMKAILLDNLLSVCQFCRELSGNKEIC